MPAILLVQGRGEFSVLSAVTREVLHHSAMDTGTSFIIFSSE